MREIAPEDLPDARDEIHSQLVVDRYLVSAGLEDLDAAWSSGRVSARGSLLLVDIDGSMQLRRSGLVAKLGAMTAYVNAVRDVVASLDARIVSSGSRDEIYVWLPSLVDHDAAATAEAIRGRISSMPMRVGDDELFLTASIGVAASTEMTPVSTVASDARAAARRAKERRDAVESRVPVRVVRSLDVPSSAASRIVGDAGMSVVDCGVWLWEERTGPVRFWTIDGVVPGPDAILTELSRRFPHHQVSAAWVRYFAEQVRAERDIREVHGRDLPTRRTEVSLHADTWAMLESQQRRFRRGWSLGRVLGEAVSMVNGYDAVWGRPQ